MTDLLFTHSVVNALGWSLIHFLWQGLGVALMFWLVCRMTREESAELRYWAGMVALLASVVLPAVTFSWYWQSHALGPVTAAYQVLPDYTVASGLQPGLLQLISSGMESAIPALVAMWAAGVLLLSARTVLGWLGAQRLVKHDTLPAAADIQAMVKRLMHQLGVTKAVSVLQSHRVMVPTVVGWIRPVILLPVAVLAKLPGEQLEMIIAHELGHIRRQDYFFNLLQLAVETLFFYHPAVRWMSRQIRQEREHCCDDLVLRQGSNPVSYARALANLENLRELTPTIALSASGGDLVHRVSRIVRREMPTGNGGFAQLAVMVGLAAVVSLSAQRGLEMGRQGLLPGVLMPQAASTQSNTAAHSRQAWAEGASGVAQAFIDLPAATEPEPAPAAVASTSAQPAATGTKTPDTVKKLTAAAIDADKQAPELSGDALVLSGQQAMQRTTSTGMSPDTSAAEFVKPLPGLLDAASVASAMKQKTIEERTRPETEPVVRAKVSAAVTVAPIYPFKARRKRAEGYVRLEFSVDETGQATNVHVVEATPPELFEKAAIKALGQWAFNVPPDHKPADRMIQRFDFTMEEPAEPLDRRDRRCDITGTRICGLKSY